MNGNGRIYISFEKLKKAITDYIIYYYNYNRKGKLNEVSPVECRLTNNNIKLSSQKKSRIICSEKSLTFLGHCMTGHWSFGLSYITQSVCVF
ncbi:hypothetical protein IRB23SM22_11400 [Alkalibacterium sp. s-m-22]|uniref:IS3 family transposase n=1 Tax=Alkalibacterium indicireducens TaxID=398758 RepID=UPI0039D317AD